MTEAELYKELGILTKDKDRWKESIPYVSSLLTHDSVKIQAKALWLLGEMGLVYPQSVQNAVPSIASFLDSPEPLLRERAVNALGRIGRGSYPVIEPYWTDLFRLTLLSVGTVIRKTDLQSVHGGENEYEPICYRRSD